MLGKKGISALAVAVLGVAAVLASTRASDASARPSRDTAEQRTSRQTQALLAALERKDARTVAALLDRRATLTLPLSFTGSQEPAARFVGKDQVLGYVDGVFTGMATIDFVDVRISVTNDGRTSFVQADGDLVTADGRPYQNVYVFRYDWDNGRIVNIDEYANPVTLCKTIGHPDC
jgi:ketosteroid isomerase-like protein